MAVPMTKSPRRTTVRRAAGRRYMSDQRYYVQCAYRVTMAIIALVALIIVTHGG